MQTIDQLLAVTDCFTIEKIVELRPKLGSDLELFYLDEEHELEEGEGQTVSEDLRNVIRRRGALQTILHAHEGDIAWLYDQVVKVAFEAGVGK